MVSSKIFRSRWSALFWAGGVLWTAYDFATDSPPSPRPAVPSNAATPVDATGEPVTADDLATLANAMP